LFPITAKNRINGRQQIIMTVHIMWYIKTIFSNLSQTYVEFYKFYFHPEIRFCWFEHHITILAKKPISVPLLEITHSKISLLRARKTGFFDRLNAGFSQGWRVCRRLETYLSLFTLNGGHLTNVTVSYN
jgi:hypothetical protein